MYPIRPLAAPLCAALLLALSLAACDSAGPGTDLDAVAGTTADSRTGVVVCHRTASDANPYVLITVGEPAVAAHRRRGSALPGEAVPGTNGAFVFDQACVPQAVVVVPPGDPVVRVVAELSCPTGTLLTGEAGTFTGSVNADATGPIAYAFDFNTDGTTDATGNPVETASFGTAGSYTVTFTATGPENFSLASCLVTVLDPVVSPVASPVAQLSCPTRLEAGQEGTFTGLVNADATGPLSYAFDFGTGLGSQGSATPTGSFTFTAAGTYTVAFTATGPGGSDSQTCDVAVVDPVVDPPTPGTVPVVASLSCPTVLYGNLPGTFTGAVNADATGPLTYLFDFGDGTTVSGSLVVEHGYTSVGLKTVTFTATGPDNADSKTCVVDVRLPSSGGGGGVF